MIIVHHDWHGGGDALDYREVAAVELVVALRGIPIKACSQQQCSVLIWVESYFIEILCKDSQYCW